MAGSGVGGLFGGGSVALGAVLLRNQRVPCSSKPLENFFISGSSSSFLGSSSMVSFEDVYGGNRSERSFFDTYDEEDNDDQDFNDYFHQPEKKRRLTIEQVQFLEKSFEVENKLEPERKIQLAKELNLQPRQVAIWFQNRRARWKTKQLGKDFDALQASYDNLKSVYDDLLEEKEKLQAEVAHLTDKLNLKQNDQQDHSDSSNLFDQSKTDEREPIIESVSESEGAQISIISSKPEDLSSGTKSEMLDSDSSKYAEGGYSALVDPCDSSYGFEADHSDISQDDEDYLNNSLLHPSSTYPEIEDAKYNDRPTDSCCFHLPSEDHASLLWPCWDVSIRM